MSEEQKPSHWRDLLKDLLLEKGFDAVIEKLEEWFAEEHAPIRWKKNWNV